MATSTKPVPRDHPRLARRLTLMVAHSKGVRPSPEQCSVAAAALDASAVARRRGWRQCAGYRLWLLVRAA